MVSIFQFKPDQNLNKPRRLTKTLISSMNDKPLVSWSFLQYKKIPKNSISPIQCFLHSATQIGSKILIYGGCDYNGEAQKELLLYDSESFQWSSPGDATNFQEDHPGNRYGHSAVLVEMHPPKIMVYGGILGAKTFEFDEPDGVEIGNSSNSSRSVMEWRRKGKKSEVVEETDEAVYFLTLHENSWVWSKPLVNGNQDSKPTGRTEHTACKTGTNEVTIFGGWSSKPTNEMWSFNYVDMEWRVVASSGIQPRPRFRHSAEVVGMKMYIFGGSDNGEDIAENSRYLGVHELNLMTMQWSHPTISGSNPFPRSGHCSALIGAHSVAIFGGKRNEQVLLSEY